MINEASIQCYSINPNLKRPMIMGPKCSPKKSHLQFKHELNSKVFISILFICWIFFRCADESYQIHFSIDRGRIGPDCELTFTFEIRWHIDPIAIYHICTYHIWSLFLNYVCKCVLILITASEMRSSKNQNKKIVRKFHRYHFWFVFIPKVSALKVIFAIEFENKIKKSHALKNMMV